MRLHGRHAPVRRAFTLLEVLLAAGIGVLLLAALYVAVDIQLRHTQAGREVTEQSTLARALVHRMANDITAAVAPPSPTRYQASSGQGSGGGSSGGQGGGGAAAGATPAASGSGSPSSAGGGTGSSGSGSGSTTGSGNYVFTLQGSSTQLTVYVNQIPRELLTPAALQGSDNPPLASDLRRITYWLAGDGSLGLARQELLLVTSDDATSVPPDGVSNEADYVIAPEVKDLTFSYFDGTNWQDSWDGTTTGSDGVTPIGPPQEVAVVLSIVPPGGREGSAKTYRHVIPIMAANGVIQQSISSSGSTQQNTGGIQNSGSTGSTSPTGS
jgi:hypothetical protein